MARIEKTVFVSYRRTNAPWVLAIYQDLTQHGFDVFYDFKGIASGDFESVLLENIRARAHFLVLLTPSALEHCGEPTDWLRREIESALDLRRNIVHLMLEGFDFRTPAIADQLTGKLAALKRYNALRVPVDYFSEAMDRLRERYLKVPLDAVLHPASGLALQAARDQQAAARAAPAVQRKELTAQQWYEQGLSAATKGDLNGALQNLDEAVRLQPDFAPAYAVRGTARQRKGDMDGAIRDYEETIRLAPPSELSDTAYIDLAVAYHRRGQARADNGDHDGAINDYTEVIRLEPKLASIHRHYTAHVAWAYNSRSHCRREKGDLDGAINDLTEAIRLMPEHRHFYYVRSVVCYMNGDLDGAIKSFTEAISETYRGASIAAFQSQVSSYVDPVLRAEGERLIAVLRRANRQTHQNEITNTS
jgi:tetratricopeptide (TPR) repeat protein